MASNFKPCSIDGGKGNAHRSATGRRGWCSAHYQRWRTHGDPLAGGTRTGAPLEFLQGLASKETDDCIPWPFGRTLLGRAQVHIGATTRSAARVVCELTHGDPPTAQHQAAHSCGKGHLGCVNPRHLRWATPQENSDDKTVHQTISRGERHASAKLTECDVLEIRKASSEERSICSLAREYSVNESTIRDIVCRKTWAWLK